MASEWTPNGPFVCGLCHRSFSRKATIQDPHFAGCVRRNGNPNKLVWDSHPSCWKRGKDGPSGLPAPGSSKSQRSEQLIRRTTVKREKTPSSDEEEPSDTLSKVELTPGWTLTVVDGWTPINGRPVSSSARGPPSDQELEPLLNSPAQSSDEHVPGPEQDHKLSGLTMNQLVNIPILACRRRAAGSDKEAAEMWDLWTNMLPEGVAGSIEAPVAGCGEKARQQAVVWLAQDVYGGLLQEVQTLRAQLKLVTIWRDIVEFLKDDEGVAKIHDLLIRALGEDGPMMLS